MKVIVPGHEYELLNHKGDRVGGRLQFVEKKKDGAELKLVKDGTTTEEVISVLIDRLEFLNKVVPCTENEAALVSLRGALKALEQRSEDREKRGVEGSDEE